MAYDDDKNLSYNGLIMLHLDRLSKITTSELISNENNDQDYYDDNLSNGELALSWGVDFLKAVIPDTLKDERFKGELEGINHKQPSHLVDFERLQVLVNLLNRKGLLMQEKFTGYFTKKGGVERQKAPVIQEVIEE